MYEIFAHTADVGITARADTLPALFADAARGLFSLIVGNAATVEPRARERFDLQADDLDDLLFDWLSELLFRFDTRHLLFVDFDVTIAGTALTGTAAGEPYDQSRHELEHEVKAITYHGLDVRRSGDGWEATVIVDI